MSAAANRPALDDLGYHAAVGTVSLVPATLVVVGLVSLLGVDVIDVGAAFALGVLWWALADVGHTALVRRLAGDQS